MTPSKYDTSCKGARENDVRGTEDFLLNKEMENTLKSAISSMVSVRMLFTSPTTDRREMRERKSTTAGRKRSKTNRGD